MGLFDRVRAAIMTPFTAPELSVDVNDGPVADAQSTPRTFAPFRDIDPNDLGGGPRGGGLWSSASAVVNMLTGQGTNRDPSVYNLWATPRLLSQGERFGMGRNALIQQALGKMPNAATREGWVTKITDPSVEDKQDVSTKISAYETRLGLGSKISRALVRGRQHGQAMVVLGIDDGQTFDKPVDVDNIRTIRWAVVIDSRDFYPYALAPATSENYGNVEQFQITDINGILEDGLRYGEKSISYTNEDWTRVFAEQRAAQGGQLLVHADRVLYFPTSDYLPLLDSLQDSLGAYFEAMHGVRTAARESSIVKYTLSKLKQQSWSKNGRLAQEHMGLVQKAKSILNAFVVDSDENVEYMNRSLAGVADLPNPIMAWVAASLGIPNTIFWQVSPGGFGKGESERATFLEDANAFQEQVLESPLTKSHGYMIVAQDGGIQLPINTQREIVFNDLTPPDEEKRSKLRSEAISDLRQLAKEGLITRPELRAAIAMLNDDFFRLELDEEFVDRPAPAQVGIFTGTIELLQALYPIETGGIPPEAGRALLLALDPVHFNPDNIPNIIPISVPEPAPIVPPTAIGGSETPILPGDEEDEIAEPSEVDIVWSQAEPPADAATAKVLSTNPDLDGVTSRQITLLAKQGGVTSYPGRGYSKEPLYSLEEVKRGLLVRQGHIQEPEEPADVVRDVGPRSLIVTFKLPPKLAQWVPYKEQDKSPPHVTLAYTKDVPPERLDDVLEELRATLAVYDPIRMHVVGEPVQYFDNGDERVAYARIEFSEAQELFDDVAEGFAAFGYSISRFGEYKPHVTLAYLAADEIYDGPAPDGTWSATEAEVSYGAELIATLPLTGTLAIDEPGYEATRDKGPLITEGRIWRTQKDGRVRAEHKKLEGKRYRPGEKDAEHGEPGDEPNCRCAWEVIVPPGGTKRAKAAAQRTVRRALRQRYEKVTGAALKRAAAKAADVEASPVRDPFRTEHAARQRDPGDFIPATFRRKTITEGVDAVLGKLKSAPQGSMVLQTYRFDSEKFTPAEARAWLVDHRAAHRAVEPARD